MELSDFIAWELYLEWLENGGLVSPLADWSNEEIISLIKFVAEKLNEEVSNIC